LLTYVRCSERKIDHLSDRLASLEELLRQRPCCVPSGSTGASTSPSLNVSSAQEPKSSIASPSIVSSANQQTPAESDDYDATAKTHTILAARIIEQAVESSPNVHQHVSLSKALHDLKEILEKGNENPIVTPDTRIPQQACGMPLDLPPRADVHEILCRIHSKLICASAVSSPLT
jgi:hypothetical protein